MSITRFIKKKYYSVTIVLLVVLVLVAASLYTMLIRPSLRETKIHYDETPVTRGVVKVTVNESGSISYAQSEIVYELDLDFSDDEEEEEETTIKYLVVEEVYKAAGERVNQGEMLLKFDQESIDSVRKLLAAAIADAQVDYNDAKSEYELDCLSAEVDYQTQLINANYGEKIYRDSLTGVSNNITSIQAEISNREGKIAGLEAAVADATEDYHEAYLEYTDAQSYLASMNPNTVASYLSYQKKYLQLQTAYYNSQTALENAKKEVDDNAEQITILKKQLESAQLSENIESISIEQEYQESIQRGENAYLVYTATLEALKEDLKEAEEKLTECMKQQEAFEELVGENGILCAPRDGLLVSVNVSAGDELTGEKILVSYVCADALTITVDVTEEDIIALSVGQHVDIELVAYPEEQFSGIIQSIETSDTSSETNTVSYPVVIGIEGDLSRMYGGMTAKVSFQTDSSEDTLYISRRALVEQNGFFYVYVKKGIDTYELQRVTVGLKNTSYVEITSGLNENDTVYIATTGA
ncbi:MAG: efflux RND transporter periplasmic adaptor subunit [Acetatifactor sp.]